MRSVKKKTAISLFSGAGGMDVGFGMAGFDVRLAVEIDPSCCDTLRRNLPNTEVLNASVNDVSPAQLLRLAKVGVGELDCVFGGPPCQSFSLAGKREGLNDERGLLVFRFVELVRQLRPKVFVLENVKGMANWGGGVVLQEIEKSFSDTLADGSRYTVGHKVLNAANFGVPQFRERVFVIGSRVSEEIQYPEITHADQKLSASNGLKPYVTVGDVLDGLPPADPPSEVAQRVSKTIKGRIQNHGF